MSADKLRRPLRTRLISPSWKVADRAEFARGTAHLSSCGLAVDNPAFPRSPLSDHDKAREINNAFKDDDIGLILARRGGAGSMRSLPFVDFSAPRSHPKLFAGFSDVSTLLNAYVERSDLITLHSPMVINMEKPTPFTVRSFHNALAGFPRRELFAGTHARTVRAGRAGGVLKGGNLITLTALIGTPWQMRADGAIVFFEDVDEKPHEVDRCFAHWGLAGLFTKIRGVILGDFRGVAPRVVRDMVMPWLGRGVPVMHCPCIGHVKDKLTLPVGARVELNTAHRSLLILGDLSRHPAWRMALR